MKEYTLLAVFSVLIAIALDRIAKTGILKKTEFYLFLLIILGFKILVNGYLTATEIVIYNPAFFLGLRLGSMPLEDFLFGFSMVTLSLVFWEYFCRSRG